MSRTGRIALSLLVTLGVILGIVVIELGGPAVRPANTPAAGFSADRAMTFFRQTIGGTVPHPVGSATNNAVRDRIVATFKALGYDTTVDRAFACNARGACGWVENITARPAGQGSGMPESISVRPAGQTAGPTVLLVAHYDSVPAGPGASDDGTSVAIILEIARAVRSEHFQNPIEFLVDDGEEGGLLGAEAFVQSRAGGSIGAVINLEARGTSGPSYLFETSRDNRWFIPAVVHALPRPATSSLFPSIYDVLPNDTDLTVFKRRGYTGVNFAYIGSADYYHTPYDDIQHVNLRSVQHQGDNALAALRTFGNSDIRHRSSGEAVWFDVLSSFVVWWPAAATLPAGIISLLVSLVAAALLIKDGVSTLGEIAAGVLVFVCSAVGALLLGLVVAVIASARAPGIDLLPNPSLAIAAAWIAGMVATLVISSAFRRRTRCAGVVAGVTIVWNVLAVVIAIAMTGASYLFIVPAIALSIVSILRGMEIADEVAGAIACSIVAAIVWFPVATTLYTGLGMVALPVIATALGIVATVFAPVFDRVSARLTMTAGAVALVFAAITAFLPSATHDRPRHVSITYLEDADHALWVAPIATDRMKEVAHFTVGGERLYPWAARPRRVATAPAPRLPLVPVSIAKVSDTATGKRVLTLTVASPRRAQRVSLFFRTRNTLDSLRINGHALPPLTRWRTFLAPQWHLASIRGGESMTVEITTRGRGPIEAIALDTSFALPPQGQSLAAARNASNAVAADDGDATVTMTRATY